MVQQHHHRPAELEAILQGLGLPHWVEVAADLIKITVFLHQAAPEVVAVVVLVEVPGEIVEQ
jgi:hypothetical protein